MPSTRWVNSGLIPDCHWYNDLLFLTGIACIDDLKVKKGGMRRMELFVL